MSDGGVSSGNAQQGSPRHSCHLWVSWRGWETEWRAWECPMSRWITCHDWSGPTRISCAVFGLAASHCHLHNAQTGRRRAAAVHCGTTARLAGLPHQWLARTGTPGCRRLRCSQSLPLPPARPHSCSHSAALCCLQGRHLASISSRAASRAAGPEPPPRQQQRRWSSSGGGSGGAAGSSDNVSSSGASSMLSETTSLLRNLSNGAEVRLPLLHCLLPHTNTQRCPAHL